MRIFDFDLALSKLAPGVSYANMDSTYEGVRWPEGSTPPTKEAVEAELTRLETVATEAALQSDQVSVAAVAASQSQLERRVRDARRSKTIEDRMEDLENMVLALTVKG